ncbi:MAG TPA: hypothetical protein VGI60_01305 [Chthoniobacterales bacterium]|jgi:hypothetical protein
MTRIFLAGLLGGIAMFIWSSIAHMALPLGETGLREIPNEQTVLDALQNNIAEKSGLYIFPGFGLGPNPTREQKNEAMKHMADNFARRPSGILMYNSAGSRPVDMIRWLGVEFLTEVTEALLAVYLLSKTRLMSFGARVGFMIVAGILAAIATNISYWNWYGFPTSYTLSYIFTQVVGFLCAGLVAGFVLRKQTFAGN